MRYRMTEPRRLKHFTVVGLDYEEADTWLIKVKAKGVKDAVRKAALEYMRKNYAYVTFEDHAPTTEELYALSKDYVQVSYVFPPSKYWTIRD